MSQKLDTAFKQVIFWAYVAMWVCYLIVVHAAVRDTDKNHGLNFTSVVLFTSFIKSLLCVVMFVVRERSALKHRGSSIKTLLYKFAERVWTNREMMRVYAVPAMLYCLYDNLSFFNLTLLNPAVYIVLSQLRAPLTGVLHQLMFGHQLSESKWSAIAYLLFGCLLNQLPAITSSATSIEGPSLASSLPVLMVLLQMLCAVFAGLYMEKLLKNNEVPVEVQNIYMYANTVLASIAVLAMGFGGRTLSDAVSAKNFQRIISLQMLPAIIILSCAGIMTSLFLKHLDSVLKSVAAAVEVSATVLCSAFIFGYQLDLHSLIGAVVVSVSAYKYSTAVDDPVRGLAAKTPGGRAGRMLLKTLALLLVLLGDGLWLASTYPVRALPPPGKGEIDAVVWYINYTQPEESVVRTLHPVTLPNMKARPVLPTGACGFAIGDCDGTGAQPCCRGWHAEGGGICGAGQETCDCSDCLDFETQSLKNSFDDTRWLLRGLHANMGPYIRNVYIVYNSLHGNGPPNNVNWKVDESWETPSHCKEPVYKAPGLVPSASVYGVPQCAFMPAEALFPSPNRDGSQIYVHRIKGLADWYLALEDDQTLMKPFDPAELFNSRGQLKVHTSTWWSHIFGLVGGGNGYLEGKAYTNSVLSARFGWRSRGEEMIHNPVLMHRGLMEEAEEEFSAEFAFTASAAGEKQEPSRRLQIQTLFSQYAIDVGAAEQVQSPLAWEIHTNKPSFASVDNLRTSLCASLVSPQRWLQVQGPGWSDEYSHDANFAPSANLHRVVADFHDIILPKPSPPEIGHSARTNGHPQRLVAEFCDKNSNSDGFSGGLLLGGLFVLLFAVVLFNSSFSQKKFDSELAA